jgi:glycosyltransferase involved in cell wall biosynthesis
MAVLKYKVRERRTRDSKMCETEVIYSEEKPLKYLFLSSDQFPPFRIDVSILFGKELIKKNHQIEFVLQSEKNCRKPYVTKWSDSTVYVGGMDCNTSFPSRVRKNIYRLLNDLKCIKLILNPNNCGIVIKDKFFTASILALFTKLFKKKFVFWLSFPFPESEIYSARNKLVKYPFIFLHRGLFFKLLLYRLLLPLAQHVFVQSEQMKKDVQVNGVEFSKITAVPMCVEIEDFENDRYSKNIDFGNEPKIIYLGAMDRIRRIDFILRVFKLVLLKKGNAKLLLVGRSEKPEDESFLEKEAERLGIQNSVVFTGFLPRQKALEYLREADVCLSPFNPIPVLKSTSPTKLVEYMAMGKPVVANQHPEQSQLINESGCGICVPYKEKKFSEAVIYLLNNPEKSALMGLRGRRYVQKNRIYAAMSSLVDNRLRDVFSPPK